MKDLKQFISGLTFARGSNQPFFLSNAIVFLSSSRADIFRLFNFENTVEGIPLLIGQKKKNMCVYCHMSKKSRVGRSTLIYFFFYRQNRK